MVYRRLVSVIGSPWALWVALGLCVAATAAGIALKSDSWTNDVNTALSWAAIFITLLILIDARREGRALHLKIDELIRAIDLARNDFRRIETADEEILDTLAEE